MNDHHTGNSHSLTIENITDYPLELALPVIEALDMEVCLDIGHLLIRDGDLETAFRRFQDRVTLMHVHGVAGGRDHQGLDRLPAPIVLSLMDHLSHFTGTVSLEVFSRNNLLDSLACLMKAWPR